MSRTSWCRREITMAFRPFNTIPNSKRIILRIESKFCRIFLVFAICTWCHCLLAVSTSANGVCVVRWWWWWALNSCSAHWTLRQHRNNHFYLYNCYLLHTCCLLIDYTNRSAGGYRKEWREQARGEHWTAFDLENSSNYQLNSSFFVLCCVIFWTKPIDSCHCNQKTI